MGCVAFDALKASEDLEKAGLSKEQARAISHVVRASHEVADVATKIDIAEVNRNVADVRKDMEFRFEHELADVATKADIAEVKHEISDVRKDMTTQISLTRKDLQLEMAGIRSEQKVMRWMLGLLIAGMVSLVVKAFFVTVV